MTELVPMMSVAEAESITEYVRAAVEAADRYADLPEILLRAREGRAWQALGYASWREWGTEACGYSKSRIYQLAAYGKALRELAAENSTYVETDTPPSEYKTREASKPGKQRASKPEDPPVDVESRPAADPDTGEVADAVWSAPLRTDLTFADPDDDDEPTVTLRPVQASLWPDDLWPRIEAETDSPQEWARNALLAALEGVSLVEYRNRQEVSRLRAQGMSLRAIERTVGIPQTTVRRLGARAEGRTEPRASEDVSPSECKHPVNRKIGTQCGVCGATVTSKR